MKKLKNCKICNSKNLVKVMKCPEFPLTGIFIKNSKKSIKKFNLNLNICKKCGHLQLDSIVSNRILYNKIYANRTSASYLSEQAYTYFKNFIFKTMKKKKLGNLVEIGCNDVTMLKRFSKFSKNCYGIDPIWRNKVKKIGNIKVIGKFVEKINLKKEIGSEPDVIITTHNLEHIEDPKKVLLNVSKNMNQNGYIFIEVPDAYTMIKNLRFDQVFHQHYHYFTLESLKNLAHQINCKVVNHSLNKKYWGGSLMVALKPNNKNKNKNIIKNKKIESFTKSHIKKFYSKYKITSKKLNSLKDYYCYGAGQMVPSVAYHLKSNFKNSLNIVDDNKYRNNFYYPNIKPKIKWSKYHKFNNNKDYFITALDGTVAIKKILQNKKIKRIVSLI